MNIKAYYKVLERPSLQPPASILEGIHCVIHNEAMIEKTLYNFKTRGNGASGIQPQKCIHTNISQQLSHLQQNIPD